MNWLAGAKKRTLTRMDQDENTYVNRRKVLQQFKHGFSIHTFLIYQLPPKSYFNALNTARRSKIFIAKLGGCNFQTILASGHKKNTKFDKNPAEV